MIHNDVLRSVRYMLALREDKLIDIARMGGLDISRNDMFSYLQKEDEEGYVQCPDKVMAHFLNGLIYLKRGKDESRPPLAVENFVSNNTVLKKLRVAFELKEEDILTILEEAGFKITGTELSSFFRKEDHRNFRPCGDQFLRNFLKGLTAKVRTF